VVERRPGVMPPKPGPPPRQVSPRRIWARRLGAVGGIGIAVLIVFAIVKIAGRGGSSTPTTTAAAIVQPKPFRIVFPEGFTRADMAKRVRVVAKIAEHKGRKPVRLSSSRYLSSSRPRAVDGFGAKSRNLEGFLFPATYDFVRGTTAQ
jgi:hypothetical protein